MSVSSLRAVVSSIDDAARRIAGGLKQADDLPQAVARSTDASSLVRAELARPDIFRTPGAQKYLERAVSEADQAALLVGSGNPRAALGPLATARFSITELLPNADDLLPPAWVFGR